MTSKVTGKNQLTIPAALARGLQIKPGTEVEWTQGPDAGTVRLYVRPSPEARLQQVRELGAPYRTRAAAALRGLERLREEEERPAARKRRRS